MRPVHALLLASSLLLGACSEAGQRMYDNSDLQLLSNHDAKELCSCLFVMEQTEEHCRAWVKAEPDIATHRIDREKKTVEAGALLFFGARARFVNDQVGCVIE